MPIATIAVLALSSTAAHSPLPAPKPIPSVRSALVDMTGLAEATPTPQANEVPWGDLPSLTGLDRTLSLQDEAANTTTVAAFGAAGSQRWNVTGRWAIDYHDTANNAYGGSLGMQWFLVDDFAFAPSLTLWGFSQEGQDSYGGGIDLMFEWHFLSRDTWSLYVDFGCGMLGTTEPVPFDGSQFNFTPQAGLGATMDIGQNRRWLIGVRWFHISNASLYANNPGRNNIMVYTGLSLPF